MLKVKGNNLDEKIDHIEKILQRFNRRLHRTVIGVIPPVPIFFSTELVPTSGTIFQCLMPANGIITNVCLYIRKFEKKEAIPFYAEIRRPDRSMSRIEFSTAKNLTIDKLNISVSPGDMLTFGTDYPDRISGIWVSFLYEIGMNSMSKVEFLIDDFEKLMEGVDDAE